MSGKRASGKHYTSVGKFPALGKKTRKILRASNRGEVSFRSFIAKAEYQSSKLSETAYKKMQLEQAMTRHARDFYQKHDGAIAWARIVQAVRLCQPLDDNFRANKKSRNETPRFEIKIRKSDFSKYYEAYRYLLIQQVKTDDKKDAKKPSRPSSKKKTAESK